MQAALAEAATRRPTIEAELAGIQKQMRETTAALDRYVQAFEAGTLPAKLCAERVNDLTAQRDQLSAHQVDLTAQLYAATPSLPDAELLADAVTKLGDALDQGDPIAVKHLLGQFIHLIEISTDWKAHPTYLIPKAPIPEPQATRGSGTPVRICEPNVELRGFEPLTPSMPWRCATSCATAPLPRRAWRVYRDREGALQIGEPSAAVSTGRAPTL